jgi:metal-responsive CopG/Arc/MetJ family transcriptional regulator
MLATVDRKVRVEIPDEMLTALDERVAELGVSRSALIRRALEMYLDGEVQTEIDRRIVEGYRHLPADDGWSDLPARAMIAAEPW